MRKPSAFIGSSREGLPVAKALFSVLSRDTKPKLWTHQIFLPGSYPLETLEQELRTNDFAVLLASPDDELLKRGTLSPAMRDNLLVEFGMFVGAVGRRRAFFVCPSEPAIALPSDLAGLSVAIYDATRLSEGISGAAAAVEVAAQQILAVIEREWRSQEDTESRAKSERRGSEQARAIRRLMTVALQLRDAVLTVQREAIQAFSDEAAFRDVIEATAKRIEKVGSDFKADAVTAGVQKEFDALLVSTSAAVRGLPFPQELVPPREVVERRAIDAGIEALGGLLSGRDPRRGVQNAVREEAGARLESLRASYSKWWTSHHQGLEDGALAMNDALYAAMERLFEVRNQGQ